jgi:hypothetical protein
MVHAPTTTIRDSAHPDKPPLTWTEAVHRASELAHSKYDAAHHGHIERGCAVVLQGALWVEEDGTVMIQSSEDPQHWWVVNSHCDCPSARHEAPEGICKHRWARALYRRAGELQRTGLPSPQPEVDDTPYADSPIPGVAPKWIKMIHGNPFIIYDGLLTMAHERGLRKLTARFVSVTDALALAEATAVFEDGREFSEASDATPDNVGFQVRPHFARLALTRAKARVLRDALNLGGLCAVEELAAE